MSVDLSRRLAGKIAVVTGGGSGIGLASARRLHAEGATVVIGDIDERTGTAAADELGGLFVPVDVSDEASVNGLYDTAADRYGSIDIAVNNAGISPPDDDLIENTELPAWQKVQDVNLKSVYLCCRAVLRHMAPAGHGSIVNIASFVAVMGSATSQISYTASKGGVLAMSRELGVQFARQGIRVNALCPGPVNTPLLQELFAKDPERAARRMVHVPMGRFGEADEIAAVVAFLASDDASFITAATYLGRRRHQRRLHHPAVRSARALPVIPLPVGVPSPSGGARIGEWRRRSGFRPHWRPASRVCRPRLQAEGLAACLRAPPRIGRTAGSPWGGPQSN